MKRGEELGSQQPEPKGQGARGPQRGNMTYEISKSQEISQDFKDFEIRLHKILPSEISRFQDFA